MAHAAESLHWYTRTGETAYTVKAKAGHDRPTTLADARKLGLVPSVTTVIGCANKPALTNWMVDQAILAALTFPRKPDEPLSDDLVARIKQDSKEQSRKAAERGTAIHAAIQGAYEKEHPDPAFIPHIEGAVSAIEKHFGQEFDPECCIAEQSFAHPTGFGGKVDLIGTAPFFVVDFKTKEFSDPESLRTWDEHAMQLAAYRVGHEMPNARCAIVYVSSSVPGLAKLIELPESDLVRGWRCFYSLLQFWKAKNNFDPSFEKALAA